MKMQIPGYVITGDPLSLPQDLDFFLLFTSFDTGRRFCSKFNVDGVPAVLNNKAGILSYFKKWMSRNPNETRKLVVLEPRTWPPTTPIWAADLRSVCDALKNKENEAKEAEFTYYHLYCDNGSWELQEIDPPQEKGEAAGGRE